MQAHAKAIRDAVEPQQARDFFKEVGLNYIILAYSWQQVMVGCILLFHDGHTPDLAYYPSTSTSSSPPPSSTHPLQNTGMPLLANYFENVQHSRIDYRSKT